MIWYSMLSGLTVCRGGVWGANNGVLQCMWESTDLGTSENKVC